MTKRFADLGQDIWPREQQTPGALAAHQKAEIEKWWPIVKAANITAEVERPHRRLGQSHTQGRQSHDGSSAEQRPPHEGRGIRLRQDARARIEAGEGPRLRELSDHRRRLAPLRAGIVQRDSGIHGRPGDAAARQERQLRQLQGRRRDAGRRRLPGHGRTRHPLSAAPDREARARRAPRRVADPALDGRDGRRRRRAVPLADAAARTASAGRGRGRAGLGLQPLAQRTRAAGRKPHRLDDVSPLQ